jgi:hypothetical protein
MQIIRPVPVTAEQYVQENFHTQIRPPENCPNCRQAHSLEALCYYLRYVTSMMRAAVLRIAVRRFFCRHCRVSIRCLPDFAQPYRLVNTSTVEAGFDDQKTRPDVQRWEQLVGSYWKCFERHLPRLIRNVGSALGPSFAAPSARQFWEQIKRACGSLATATRQLVNQFHTCLFGTYRCHQRKSYQAR